MVLTQKSENSKRKIENNSDEAEFEIRGNKRRAASTLPRMVARGDGQSKASRSIVVGVERKTLDPTTRIFSVQRRSDLPLLL
jgi:hypothetical protein